MHTVSRSALRAATDQPAQLAVAAAALSSLCATNEHASRQLFYTQNKRLHPTYLYLLHPVTDEEIENAKQNFIITYQRLATKHKRFLRHTKHMWEQGKTLRLNHHKLPYPIPGETSPDSLLERQQLQSRLVGPGWSMFGQEAASILYVFEMCKPSNSALTSWSVAYLAETARDAHALLLDGFLANVAKVMRCGARLDRRESRGGHA